MALTPDEVADGLILVVLAVVILVTRLIARRHPRI